MYNKFAFSVKIKLRKQDPIRSLIRLLNSVTCVLYFEYFMYFCALLSVRSSKFAINSSLIANGITVWPDSTFFDYIFKNIIFPKNSHKNVRDHYRKIRLQRTAQNSVQIFDFSDHLTA